MSFPAAAVDNGQAGFVTPTGPMWTLGNRTLSAGTVYAGRFVAPRRLAVVSVAFAVVTAASADDPVQVGIYDASRNLIASSAATSGLLNSTGAKAVNLSASVTLEPGRVYYSAILTSTTGGTAAVVQGANLNVIGVSMLFGSAAPQIEAMFMASQSSLPATISVGNTALVAYLAVRT